MKFFNILKVEYALWTIAVLNIFQVFNHVLVHCTNRAYSIHSLLKFLRHLYSNQIILLL